MLSDFKTVFAEQSRRLDDQLLYENDADKQLLQEKWEQEAQANFLRDMKEIGQELSETEIQTLVQYLLDLSYDIRIEGSFVQGYIAASAEGLFEKIRNEQAEETRQAELDAIKPPTIAEQTPTVQRIEGNRTVTSYRREGDEGITPEEMSSITPDKLDKATLKRLRLAAGKSRRENMTEKAEQALDRGERIR